MTTNYIQFNANRESDYISSLVSLGDEMFTFVLRWNEYCNCFFMDIIDLDGNYIISGIALVNNLFIRHYKLPYVLFFTHQQGKNYEPTIDNMNEFGLYYDDGAEE